MLKLSSKVFHCFIIVALVTALLPAGAVKAASDFYVRTDGADTCDGSVDAPWTDGVTACAFATMQKAIDSAANGDTINVAAGTYVLSSAVTVNKDVTLNGVGNPLIQVSGTDHRIIMNTAGATLQGFQIEKTDKTGTQNIIYVGASDLTIQNNKIWGQYEFGDGEVSRAMEFTGGLSGLTIANNEIFDLRQPAYINGVSTGTISNNYVYRTRGWVVAGGNLTFVDNTWGTGSDSNIYDIALISSVEPTYYTDLAALAAANNGAFIEDQRTTPATLSIVYVDGSVAASGDGTARSPKKTIAEGVDRVASGGTVHVAAGTYDESVIQIKKGMNLLGAGAGASIIAPTATGNYNIIFVTNPSGDVTIDGFTFVMPEFTSYGTAIAVTDTAGAIDEHTVTISNNIIEGTANGALGTDYGFYGQGNNAKLIIANNTINKTGSNSICMEQQKGSTEVINNTISITNDVYYDPYFSMVYSGTDVTTPQIVSGNTFHLAHTGDGYSTAITFVAAANGKWANDPNDSGHFHNIQILNNTIYTEGEDGRGIGISDNSHDAVKGVIEGVLISGNTIQGVNSSDANSRGIRLEGNIQGTVIQNNEIHNLLDGVVIAGGLKNCLYPSGTVIQNNRITGNTTNLTWDHPTDTLSATPNWWGTVVKSVIDSQISGLVEFTPYYLDEAMTTLSGSLADVYVDNDYIEGSAGGHTFGYDAFVTVQEGIQAVGANGTVHVAAGTYVESGQIIISKNLNIIGVDKATTIIKPAQNTGSSGDARGWFVVNSGVSFELANVTLDGEGWQIYDVIRSHGSCNIHDNTFKNIFYPTYYGRALALYDGGISTVTNNNLENIGRIGIFVYGTGTNATITGNTYTGKGIGDWLDYGIEIGSGGHATIEGNTITACLGTASVDGSASASILITTYAAAGSQATITGNTLTGNTNGIHVGYNETDTSTVVARNNNLSGNLHSAIASTAPAVDAAQNWWGTASAASIINQISGPVTFNPYYINAAMTMLSDVAPTSVFVDDDFTDGSAGGHTFGYDAFATIQDGINGVAVGGTVNVAAGNYDGQNKILKSVTLLGDPGDASAGPGTNAPVVDGGGNPGDAFLIENGVSNVVIQGFVMSNFTSDSSGIGNGISAWEASTSNITIQDNYFHHLGWNAVMVGNDGALGDHTNWTIKANILESWSGYGFELTNASNSIIEGNIITADVVSEPWTAIAVIARRNESGITIKGNQISGQFTDANAYPAVYIMAWDAETPSLNLDNVVVEDNIITISKPTAKLNQILIREISTGTVTNVRVLHNSLQTARTLTANAIDFTENWWGYSTGPAQGAITGDLSFSPWCADSACSSLGYSIAAGSDVQDTLDEAEPGDTIYVPAGSYEGALVINKPGITLIADRGAVFSSGLAAITIQTHDFTMLGGVIDGDPNNTGTRSNSACVVIHHDSLPLDNIHLEGVEIKNCTAGIDITSPVTNLKLISNWLHANSGDGLLFEKFATSSGENTLIQGNMFKENGGYGVRNESKSTVDASYNSWGAPTVATGNRVKGKIKASYPTYAEAFLDLQPNKNVSQVTIQKDATLTTALRVDARSLYGVEAVLHYDPDYLTYMNYAAGNFPGKGSCEVKINTPEEGDLTVICRRANPDPEANSVYTLVQLNFVANGSKLTDEDELYETSFDITAATAATRNGVNVFANNFGHGASSAWGIRTINDDNDGLVKITTESISAVNVPGFSGFVKLQGRSDNQGAKFSVFTTNNPASAFVIQTISAADGSYLGTSSNFAVRSKYYLLVDAPLYLPTTPQAAPTLADFKTLNKNNVTLKSVQLLGGDASDDNQVTLTDATCVAADYNKTPGTCNGVGSSDVNGDGEVNLLDLVMVGNSYNKTSSPWTP
jgi:hypothetical protein